MNFPTPEDLISAYFDGETSPEETAAAEALLTESPAARKQLAELKALSGMIRGLPAPESPGDLSTLVLQRAERASLLGDRPAEPVPAATRSPRRWIPYASLLATVAALLMVMAFWPGAPWSPPSRTVVDTGDSFDDSFEGQRVASMRGRSSEVDASGHMSLNNTFAAPMSPASSRPDADAAFTGSSAAKMGTPGVPPLRLSGEELASAAIGDVLEAIREVGPGEVVVVRLTVVDRVESLTSLQLLLQDNAIPAEENRDETYRKRLSTADPYAFYVESDTEQISTVFAQLQRDAQFAEIEVASLLPTEQLNRTFVEQGYPAVPVLEGAEQQVNEPTLADAEATQQWLEGRERSAALNRRYQLKPLPSELDSKNGVAQQAYPPPRQDPSRATDNRAPDASKGAVSGRYSDTAKSEAPAPRSSKDAAPGYELGNRSRQIVVTRELQKQVDYFDLDRSSARGPEPPPEPLNRRALTTADKPATRGNEPTTLPSQVPEVIQAEQTRRGVQVLFVLVPMESPANEAPADPATTKPAENPEGAS